MSAGNSVQIQVDAGRWLGHLPHNWTYIGYDEINYTYTPEGKELLAKFQGFQEQPYYVRAHHLLCTGNCHGFYKWGSTNAYLEDEAGNPIYDWTFVDRVLDTLLQHNCKPFVEIGFMPLHLADPAYNDPPGRPWTAKQYQLVGWACPPKDYQRWYDLIYRLVEHCGQRYGAAEIATWYWELWNEPDIFYWQGSREEFDKLYDYTVSAVKAACPQARVGGPGVTNPNPQRESAAYLDGFLDHCVNGTNYVTGGQGTPLDFLSFHVKGGGYQADPLHRRQRPPSVQRMVQDVQTGYEIIRRYPGHTELECVLSEIDPDGWAAGGAWDNANLGFRNTEYYASFVAAAFDGVSRFARERNWDLKLLTWAFLFVGERCFEGTRAFSTQGIDKAILNLFRMFARLGQTELHLESSAAQDPLSYADPNGFGMPPVLGGVATRSGSGEMAVLLYSHHDDWGMCGDRSVELTVENLERGDRPLRLCHYRIDGEHSNAYGEWVRQGRPMYPETGLRAALSARAGLSLLEPPRVLVPTGASVCLEFEMPVHAVSLVLLSPEG